MPEQIVEEFYWFVTGKLAAPTLRRVVESLSGQFGFRFQIDVLPISVAALMTTEWVAKRLPTCPEATRLILPGYCEGSLDVVQEKVECLVERGPADLRRLPEHFGKPAARSGDYNQRDIEIIAEINHAPKRSITSVVDEARRLARQGADTIDLGSIPNHDWLAVGDYVKALKDEGLRVSIDSLMPAEIERAVRAGAELVLSVNSSNREAAQDWGCEVVAIPDQPTELGTLASTVEYLDRHGVKFRLDPILEPIGCGFAASLQRYWETRNRWPEAPMMMGIGNLTELTDVDSAGINVVLLGFCQELRITSVLTTQVINWARSSVQECRLAACLVREAVRNGVPPKHIEEGLVVLRDPKLRPLGEQALAELAAAIKDNNYRIFAERGELHLMGNQRQFRETDPFLIFDQLLESGAKNLSASHAFYLGYELCKAETALQLGKEYQQDRELNWGYLSREEKARHRISRRRREPTGGSIDDNNRDTDEGDS